ARLLLLPIAVRLSPALDAGSAEVQRGRVARARSRRAADGSALDGPAVARTVGDHVLLWRRGQVECGLVGGCRAAAVEPYGAARHGALRALSDCRTVGSCQEHLARSAVGVFPLLRGRVVRSVHRMVVDGPANADSC